MRSASTTRPVNDQGRADADWWRQAVVYQIYPRSFADSDGNGLGDLPGVISRIPYLASLGIDAVWLSPFYPSALADGGYDVDDYRVAEAWVHPSRRPLYASPDGLGQAFNFDLLEANWNAGEFLRVITDNLSDAQRQGPSTTWVLSNHDLVRHATRYGLPPEDRRGHQTAREWLLSGGTSPRLDRGLGLRRARAAILLMLALPGSAYLYQGEELGLHEVPDIPFELVQDPCYARSQGAEKGRDGCRVPLPWTADGPSFGFGTGAAHLPQPAWFGPLSVQAQERDPASILLLYRNACGGGTSCRPQRAWSGCQAPTARCCTSPVRAAGAA